MPVRGVSGLTKLSWVEWQKHRSLWRYFQKYEAAQTPGWMDLYLDGFVAALYFGFIKASAKSISQR